MYVNLCEYMYVCMYIYIYIIYVNLYHSEIPLSGFINKKIKYLLN